MAAEGLHDGRQVPLIGLRREVKKFIDAEREEFDRFGFCRSEPRAVLRHVPFPPDELNIPRRLEAFHERILSGLPYSKRPL